MNYHFKHSIKLLFISLMVLLLINSIAYIFYFRLDLTAEKRYTLTPATKNLLQQLKQSIEIEVYLDGNDLPVGIKKLRNETKELLQEFRRYSNGRITYKFIDVNAIKNKETKEKKYQELIQQGIKPINLEVNTNSGYLEKLVFPGALLKIKDRINPIQILENQFAFGAQGSINNSINFLEYKLANGVQKLIKTTPPKVVFLQGHGELEALELQEMLKNLVQQNFIVDKLNLGEQPLLNANIDILVIARPQTNLLDEEKFLIDQFIMHGGKVLWLLEASNASLANFQLAPTLLATPLAINVDDLLFRYGVRINFDLVLDLYCSQIPIIETVAGNQQPKLFPWVFFPIAIPKNNHPIIKNLDPIWFKFPSSIDTLANPSIRKTILASTSTYTRTQQLPFEIYLQGAKQKPNPYLFNKKEVPMAVLLEGNFKSLFANQLTTDLKQILAKQQQNFKSQSSPNKMIVVADADIIINDVDSKGVPMALGYDKFTQQQFSNKDFLLNCFEYLIDDNHLIEARNREIKMRLLDKAKVLSQKGLWQFIVFAVPLVTITLFGIFYNHRRKKLYAN